MSQSDMVSSHAAHAGKIAHARIYKGSLSQAEIERDIGSDRLSLVPFRKSHPIDFRLNDDDDQPVLYIVDDSADAKVALVKLELTNTSPQAINIPPADIRHQSRSSPFCPALSPGHAVCLHHQETDRVNDRESGHRSQGSR